MAGSEQPGCLRAFRIIWRILKPRLDDAFKGQLSLLLGNIALRDAAALWPDPGGGKKIRGCLSCMMSEAFGGNPRIGSAQGGGRRTHPGGHVNP